MGEAPDVRLTNSPEPTPLRLFVETATSVVRPNGVPLVGQSGNTAKEGRCTMPHASLLFRLIKRRV